MCIIGDPSVRVIVVGCCRLVTLKCGVYGYLGPLYLLGVKWYNFFTITVVLFGCL